MTTTSSIRIDDDVHASACIVAPVMSRSTAQQVAHWARIGRELERSPNVSHADISKVLAGSSSYDDLNDHEQAIVRAQWREAMTERVAQVDLSAELAGRSYAELDEDGNPVIVEPTA